MKKSVLPLAVLFALACHQGILQPQMEVKEGSFTKPAATIGKFPDQPWSATTVEAAVSGRPLAGKLVTITGEVIDLSCYLQLGKHGEAHKDCAQKCMKAGNPIGLLDKDGGIHILMAEEHHPRRDGKTGALRDALIEKAASIVTVTGTYTFVNGYCAIFVSGFVRD